MTLKQVIQKNLLQYTKAMLATFSPKTDVAELVAKKTTLNKISEDANGNLTFNGNAVTTVGIGSMAITAAQMTTIFDNAEAAYELEVASQATNGEGGE